MAADRKALRGVRWEGAMNQPAFRSSGLVVWSRLDITSRISTSSSSATISPSQGSSHAQCSIPTVIACECPLDRRLRTILYRHDMPAPTRSNTPCSNAARTWAPAIISARPRLTQDGNILERCQITTPPARRVTKANETRQTAGAPSSAQG